MTVRFLVNTLGFFRGDVVTFSGEEGAFSEIDLLVTHGMLEEVPE
jgi:hypothetical protein